MILSTPKIFGFEHIIVLILLVSISITSIFFIKKKVTDEEKINKIIKGVGWLLLASIIFSRISITLVSKRWYDIFPDSFCAFSSFLFSLVIIIGKKDNIALHGVAYIGVMGGLATMVYPDFIEQSETIFYAPTISGLLHHVVMVYLFFLIIITGYLKPTIKKWYAILICGTIYMTYGLLLYQIFNLDGAMLIGEPIIHGTWFYWYVIGPAFLVLYYSFILIWEFIKKKKMI